MSKPYERHIKSPEDLATTYEATRAGFVYLALEKNRKATPFVEEARALKVAASVAKKPNDLLGIYEIQQALLTAAGVSDKAGNHLLPQDKEEAVKELIRNFLDPAGEKFVEELVFRFLLIRGDALGGSMRNIGGVLAQRKLTRAIISALKVAGRPYQWLTSQSNQWATNSEDDTGIEFFVKGISWNTGKENRSVLYNVKVPVVGNNVDLCLLDCEPNELDGIRTKREILYVPAIYIALGELKGGIDPAGADEHWKTARTALSRIRNSFEEEGYTPHLFFVGAAIESRMALEIWNMLESGTLSNAANLNDDNQIFSLSLWLCGL